MNFAASVERGGFADYASGTASFEAEVGGASVGAGQHQCLDKVYGSWALGIADWRMRCEVTIRSAFLVSVGWGSMGSPHPCG